MRISRKGEVRNDMESTRMARNSRHGMADAGWRGASGSGRDCCGRPGSMRRGRRGPRGMAWYGNAGMEKPVKARGMEGSGTVGIMKARQAWRGPLWRGTMWNGQIWQEWSGMDWTGTENLGRHGVGAAVGTVLD